MRNALTGIAAVALGVLLALRVVDGSVNALVQDWYTPLLELSAVVLIALGGVVLFRTARTLGGTRPFRPRVAGIAITVLVGAPIVLGFALKPEPLTGASLSSDDQPQFLRTAPSGQPLQRNIYQWAYAFATDTPSTLAGQPVDLVGFIHHGKEDSGDRVSVARFVVACCVADASGYTLPVRWKDAAALKDDDWVRVKGRVVLGDHGEPIVQAESVEAVATPDSPYIYP